MHLLASLESLNSDIAVQTCRAARDDRNAFQTTATMCQLVYDVDKFPV